MVGCDMVIELHPRIIRLDEMAVSASYPGTYSTNCHRDFLASWAIKEGRLYLIDVIGIYNLIGEELLFAEWYRGTIRAGAGKFFRGSGFGYDFRCEREFAIDVNDGVVINMKERMYEESGRQTNVEADALQPYEGEIPSWIRSR